MLTKRINFINNSESLNLSKSSSHRTSNLLKCSTVMLSSSQLFSPMENPEVSMIQQLEGNTNGSAATPTQERFEASVPSHRMLRSNPQYTTLFFDDDFKLEDFENEGKLHFDILDEEEPAIFVPDPPEWDCDGADQISERFDRTANMKMKRKRKTPSLWDKKGAFEIDQLFGGKTVKPRKIKTPSLWDTKGDLKIGRLFAEKTETKTAKNRTNPNRLKTSSLWDKKGDFEVGRLFAEKTETKTAKNRTNPHRLKTPSLWDKKEDLNIATMFEESATKSIKKKTTLSTDEDKAIAQKLTPKFGSHYVQKRTGTPLKGIVTPTHSVSGFARDHWQKWTPGAWTIPKPDGKGNGTLWTPKNITAKHKNKSLPKEVKNNMFEGNIKSFMDALNNNRGCEVGNKFGRKPTHGRR